MPSDPTRVGYVFMGWYLNPAGGTAFSATQAVYSHMSIYAIWGRTVTVVDSEATVTGAGNYLPGAVVTINAGTRTGFTFSSWSVIAGTVNLADANVPTTSFTMPNENVSLIANWNRLYTLRVTNSYAGSPGAGDYLAGVNVTIRAGSRSGYSFEGWTVNLGSITLNDSNAATARFIMPAENVEVTANWAELFAVSVLTSYAPAGSSGAGNYTVSSTVTINAGIRTTHRFNGWTVAQGSAILADASQATTTFSMPAGPVIVQATWVATSTVTFDANGGNPTTQSITVDTGTTVQTLPAVTNPGFVLVGWFTSPTGTVEFTDTTPVNSNITVYARWGYQVTVADSYANVSGAGNYQAGSTVTIYAGTRSAYRFDSWAVISGSLNLGSAAQNATTSFTMPLNDVSLRAQWVPTSTVAFNGNGGLPILQTVAADTGYSLGLRMPTEPMRSGYQFIGWYTGSNSGEEFNSSTIVNSDITVYAHWGRTVTVVSSYSATSGAGVYRPGDMVAVDAGVNSGYDFVSWSVTQGSLVLTNPRSTTTSFTMPDSNLTLVASWAALFTLNVDASYAGSGNTGAGSYTSGAQVTVQAGTRTGYNFSGWTSNAGGSFTNANLATTSFTMPPANTTVTASWTPLSMTVNFDRNNTGACIGPSFTVMTVAFDSPYGTLPIITSYGYRFEGWYTSATGGTLVLSTTVVTEQSNHTLYAHWQKIGDGEVGNNGPLYTIMASSPVCITQAQAQAALTDSTKIIDYTNALATEVATGLPAAIVVTNLHVLSTVPGAYLITLAVAAEPSTAVTVMVIVTETTRPPVLGVTHIIVAEPAVYLSIAEAEAILNGNLSDGLITTAGVRVRAYDKETGAPVPPSGLSVSSNPLFAAVVGLYSVAFSVVSDPAATISTNFVVTDSTLPPVLGATHVIMADSPVFLSTNEASNLISSGLDAGLIAKARVRVCVKDTGVTVYGITVTGSALFAPVEGAYMVSFTATADSTATIDVLFIVTDANLPPVVGDSYVIVASSPVKLSVAQAQGMVGANLSSNLISAGGVRAYNKRTGIAVSPAAIQVQSTPVFNGAEGIYRVTYMVASDSRATITSLFVVSDGNIVNVGDYYVIYANSPVRLTTEQASVIGNNTLLLIGSARVKAFDLLTGSQVLPSALRVASGSLGTGVGSYTIRFEVAADTSSYVDVVFIVTSSLIVEGDTCAISANSPVILSTNDAQALLGANLAHNLVAAASVSAFEIESGAAIPESQITVSSNPSFTAVEGVYRVVFTVATDARATITVLFIVTDNNLVVTGDS
jgi:uncharacterized repeat protein (TIGR02543 family)